MRLGRGDKAIVLAQFAALHPEYATPDGAENNCFDASVEFQEFLFGLRLIDEAGREKSWDVEQVYFVAGRPVPYRIQQHWVFRWGDQYIDWTARQMWSDAEFPVVWSVPS